MCNRGTAGVNALRQELQGGPRWAGLPELGGGEGGGVGRMEALQVRQGTLTGFTLSELGGPTGRREMWGRIRLTPMDPPAAVRSGGREPQ